MKANDMSNNLKDGGPAFPSIQLVDLEGRDGFVDKDGNVVKLEMIGGLTVLDWFAGQALAGMIGQLESEDPINNTEDLNRSLGRMARLAFMVGQAMVAERERLNGGAK